MTLTRSWPLFWALILSVKWCVLSEVLIFEQISTTLSPTEEEPGAIGVSYTSELELEESGVAYSCEQHAEVFHYAKSQITRYKYKHSIWGSYTSPYLYHALLNKCMPGDVVSFCPQMSPQLPNNNPANCKKTFSIKLTPLASAYGGDPARGVTLALVGDLGQTRESLTTMKHLVNNADKNEVSAVLLVGDLSYADKLQTRWDLWGKMFTPVFTKLPLMALPGNHEIEKEKVKIGKHTKFKPYSYRFQMKPNCKDCGGYTDSSGWQANMWYSFDIGNAHIIHLSSYHDCDHDSEQFKWLVKDLKAVNREATPWVIVNLHAPWYNSNAVHQNESESVDVRRHMQPLLCSQGVNVMFAGHVHSYERIYPTCSNSTINSLSGITYINIGDGGNREGIYHDWLPGENGQKRPVWSAYREGSYGYGFLKIHNETHATWTWHRNQDPEVVIQDSVVIMNYRILNDKIKTKINQQEEDVREVSHRSLSQWAFVFAFAIAGACAFALLVRRYIEKDGMSKGKGASELVSYEILEQDSSNGMKVSQETRDEVNT